MIDLTAQKSALQAIRLTNLLEKKWTEKPGYFRIQKQIRTDKQRTRLNEMTSNRYII